MDENPKSNATEEQKKTAKIPAPEDMSKDEVDLNEIESFPASDPPSWMSGRKETKEK